MYCLKYVNKVILIQVLGHVYEDDVKMRNCLFSVMSCCNYGGSLRDVEMGSSALKSSVPHSNVYVA